MSADVSSQVYKVSRTSTSSLVVFLTLLTLSSPRRIRCPRIFCIHSFTMFFASSMLVFVLVAVSSVQAIPTPQPSFTVSQSIVTTSQLSITTSQASTITSQASATTSHSSNTTASITTPGPGPIVSNAAALASGLKSEHSVDDRLKKLLYDSNGILLTGEALRQLTVFDFNNQAPAAGAKGGSILLATVDNFPILEELGISGGAISFVQPCGLNIPHTHPCASEFFFVVEGILDTGFVQENGFNTQIETQLGTHQGTVFPMGNIHYQQNPTCSPAVLVAALNNEDPGRSDIATNFWMLDSDVIDAALGFPTSIGGDNIDQWRSHLPVNLAAGIDSCLQACGLMQ